MINIPKKYKSVAIFIAISLISFGYGTLVGRFKVFPYHYVKEQYIKVNKITSGITSKLVSNTLAKNRKKLSIETLLTNISGKKYNLLKSKNISKFGASITKVGDRIVGADGSAELFIYRKGGNISKLDVNISTNRDLFLSYLKKKGINANYPKKIFRVLDITSVSTKSTNIFVSYHYWNPRQKTKTVRVSRLQFNEGKTMIDTSIDSIRQKLLYESQPPIEIGGPPYNVNHSMFTRHVGGRLAVAGDSALFLSLGDYRFDGMRNSPMAPQVDSSSYGKIIRIDLDTYQSTHFAKGLRNPEGLHIDSSGRIWETEHGPYGGDELNLIEKGENYGWPLVTYGRWYNSYSWPLSDRVGWHEGYTYPYHVWRPGTGISNLIQIHDTPSVWDRDLLVSSLNGTSLFRLRVRDDRVVLSERIPVGVQIRDLEQMTDGSILLLTEGARFVELRPSTDSTQMKGTSSSVDE